MFHPVTGRRYVICLRDDAAPFVDIRTMYLALAASHPWLSVVSPETLGAYLTSTTILDDASWTFVLWEPLSLPMTPPKMRRATVTVVYSEAYGGQLLPAHQAAWDRFRRWAESCDWVWCHTPNMQQWLHAEGLCTRLLPVGYHESMGTPGDSGPNPSRRHFAYWGSRVGLRETLVREYTLLLPNLQDFTGQYGRALHESIDKSLGALYLPHSNVWSGSTWRLWQSVSTSAPLISWESDLWPAKPNDHYLVPPSDDPTKVCAWLKSLSWARDLEPVAKKAHADLAGYDPLHYLTA